MLSNVDTELRSTRRRPTCTDIRGYGKRQLDQRELMHYHAGTALASSLTRSDHVSSYLKLPDFRSLTHKYESLLANIILV